MADILVTVKSTPFLPGGPRIQWQREVNIRFGSALFGRKWAKTFLASDSDDEYYEYLDSLRKAADVLGLSIDFPKPPVIYVPMGSSSMYHCTWCKGLDGQAETLRHKRDCPNYVEGKPFTPELAAKEK